MEPKVMYSLDTLWIPGFELNGSAVWLFLIRIQGFAIEAIDSIEQ